MRLLAFGEQEAMDNPVACKLHGNDPLVSSVIVRCSFVAVKAGMCAFLMVPVAMSKRRFIGASFNISWGSFGWF